MNDNPYNRCPIGPGKYVVLCRDNRQDDGSKGKYALATSDAFEDRKSAIRYRDSISSSREPIIARLTL